MKLVNTDDQSKNRKEKTEKEIKEQMKIAERERKKLIEEKLP